MIWTKPRDAISPSGLDAVSYSELAATSVDKAVERAYTAVGPKTVAKYLFTSGSTGFPKAVKAGHKITRIAIAFETGRDGFWLARWLRAHGIEAHVIHAASVPVSREHRRAKTDYGDGDDELPSKGPKGGQRPSPGRRRVPIAIGTTSPPCMSNPEVHPESATKIPTN